MTPARDPNDLIGRLFALAAAPAPPATFGRFRYLADPEAALEVLRAPDVFIKDMGVLELLGRSRFAANGEEWRARRDLTQPQFQRAGRPAVRPLVHDLYARVLAERDAGGSPPVATLLTWIMEVGVRTFFDALGVDADAAGLIRLLDSARAEMFDMQCGALCSAAGPAAPRRTPRQAAAAFTGAFHRYCEQEPSIRTLFETWRQTYAGPGPFDAEGEFLSNLMASFETSASAVAWAIDRLGADPERQETLRADLSGEALTRFVNEVLRFFPPVAFVSRATARPYRSDRIDVPAGVQMLISIIGVHRHPSAWSEPLRFDPDRPEFAAGAPPKGAFIPFVTGLRTCGGVALARIQMEEGLKALLQRYRFTRAPDAPIRYRYLFTLQPVFKDSLTVARL